MIDREIGSYKIVNLIGRGGMGEVYKAQHPYIGKQVAIKLLKTEQASDTEVVQRFFQEAKAVNNIQHENVIDVLDFGKTPEGEYFIIMELLEGKTLSQALTSEAPFPKKRTGHVSLQICSALAAAHEKGIIHRDLKSDNIFLITRGGKKDFVKVLDFGIAKLMNDPSGGAHTTTGMVMGTPLYMAPEQALGRPLDAQTDVYALGVILFQMATGTVPFFDPNPVALATMHVTTPAPKPSKFFAVSPALELIILKCLEKEKKDRFASMKDVAKALAEVCQLNLPEYFTDVAGSNKLPKVDPPATQLTPKQAPQPKRRSSPLLYVGAVAVALGVGGVLWASQGTKQPSTPTKIEPAPVSEPTKQPAAATQSQPATAPVVEKITTPVSEPSKSTKQPTKQPPKPKTEAKTDAQPETKVEPKIEPKKEPEKKPKIAGDSALPF